MHRALRRPFVSLFACLLIMPAVASAQDLIITFVDASLVSTDCQTLEATGTVAATVRNDGASSSGVAFTVRFFEDLDNNDAYDGTDLLLGDVVTTGPLAAGAEETVSVPVAATIAFSDNRIHALADANGEVGETDEGNNVYDSGKACLFQPTPGPFAMVEEWNWNSSANSSAHTHVMMTPIVVNLTDDNGDTEINDLDVPDVVFSTFEGAAYQSNGVLRAVNGDDGTEIFTTPLNAALDVLGEGSIAVGDIDGDGMPEIIANEDISETHNIDAFGRFIVFEHDGTFKFTSDLMNDGRLRWGGAALADLNGDGTPEIVVGRHVMDNTGAILAVGTSGKGDNSIGPLSTVADIDRDGTPDIVAGFTVYDVIIDGSNAITGLQVKWEGLGANGQEVPGDGFPGVGDFDDDDLAEVVVVSNGSVYLFDDDGSWIWGPSAIPGGGRGGAPNIDDFDGDGEPEIGTAGGSQYAVFETDGTLLWSSATQDQSSNMTGSSVFDFEADGSAEVIYKDETTLRIYRGSDGVILASVATGSGTTYENPVIANVDRDGNAEIIICANDYAFGSRTGIQVFGDANDQWVDTRRIWNQHTYHITNVTDDATIPATETDNWLTFNSFRSQSAGSGPAVFAAPDLTASFIRDDNAPCPPNTSLIARVGNGGANVAAAPIDVAFYDGDPDAAGVLLGVVQTTVNLNPGEWEDVKLVVSAGIAPALICVVADDDGTGSGTQSECDETNNKCCASFEAFCLEPPVCDAGGPYTGLVGQSIDFDGSASFDPDGTIVDYDWTFGDSGTGSGPTPSHAYAAPGTYTVTLTVTDDDGLSTSCETEAVIDQPTPVMLAWMDGEVTVDGVVLHWRTGRETGTLGFHVHRQVQGGLRERVSPSLIESHGAGVAYRFDDHTAQPDMTYDYWLEAQDVGGVSGFHGPFRVVVSAAVPSNVALHAARPNPFNPTTTLTFDVPAEGEVTLTIFAADGRAVRVLVDGIVGRGRHAVQWDGRDDASRALASGIYLYRLRAGGEVFTRKLVLAK